MGVPLCFGTSPAIVDDVDLLRRWWREDVGYANYEIEPGCEYRESFATAVRADELLELEVTFHWQGYIWPPVYDLRRRQLRWREQDRLVEYAIFRTGPADATAPAEDCAAAAAATRARTRGRSLKRITRRASTQR
jgi:hypothetical protein